MKRVKLKALPGCAVFVIDADHFIVEKILVGIKIYMDREGVYVLYKLCSTDINKRAMYSRYCRADEFYLTIEDAMKIIKKYWPEMLQK